MVKPITCACGCGKPVRPGRQFRQGHNVRGRSGESAAAWKGGHGRDNLHQTVYAPDNPRARQSGNPHIPVHIIMAEAALGCHLRRGAVTWFLDGRRDNPTPGNFVICPNLKYRHLLERRKQALVATGNMHSIRCSRCRKWVLPKDQNQTGTRHRKGQCGK